VRAHRPQGRLGLLLWHHGDELSLIGDVERIDAEQLARRAHGGPDRQR
jgi:hypothetical protein